MIDWNSIRLVVFDVDGTLYDQKALRARMALLLLRDCAARRSLRTLRLLSSYRKRREELALATAPFSEIAFLTALAAERRLENAYVLETVDQWIHHQPLQEIRRFRYPGVAELFHTLRDSGRTIGILSDHPAQQKLSALDLTADCILAADDGEVRSLKPNPQGLKLLMEKCNALPETTLMIGDRPERDGEMARRANVRALIRSDRPKPGWSCFSSFSELMAEVVAAPDRVADAQ